MKSKVDIIISFGTRPEIIKLAPLINLIKEKKINFKLIYSNQHFSKNMSKIFFNQFGINNIDYNLNLKKKDRISFEKKFFDYAYNILKKEKPKIVIVQGDTKTCLISALAANASRESNKQIKIFHIEAGLRSYDYSMPEEMNRVTVDHLSDYLFPPTIIQKNILVNENIKKKIFVVGSTLSDNLKNKNFKKIEKSFILLTIHRYENLISKTRFKKIINIINYIAKKRKIQIIFPIHPNTKNKMHEYKISLNKKYIKLAEPLDYEKFLILVKNAKIILSDSGGIQEEACILKTPHITLRDNTERPETINIKSNYLLKLNPKLIDKKIDEIFKMKKKWKDPYGNNVSLKILKQIKKVIKF